MPGDISASSGVPYRSVISSALLAVEETRRTSHVRRIIFFILFPFACMKQYRYIPFSRDDDRKTPNPLIMGECRDSIIVILSREADVWGSFINRLYPTVVPS